MNTVRGQSQRLTEAESGYTQLSRMSVKSLLANINREDRKVPIAVAGVIPALERLVNAIVRKMRAGGRLFYIGAGTSGRLGVLDAAEIPPTYGVPQGLIIAIIAGGDPAIRRAVEFAEDDACQGWKDLEGHGVGPDDVVLGIAASGSTPYVVGALEKCKARGITTACLTSNRGSALARAATHTIEILVGPEFITGSTRMKSGTAQKLALNMISTATMIKLGRVRGNRMVDMQPTNAKLVERGTRMIMRELNASWGVANALLREHGTVRQAVDAVRPRKKAGSPRSSPRAKASRSAARP